MARAHLALLGLVAAGFMLVGCAAGPTSETLDGATTRGAAPIVELEAEARAVNIGWEQLPDVTGWQAQYRLDDAEEWTEKSTDLWQPTDDGIVLDGTNFPIEEGHSEIRARVRAIYGASEVSPWTEAGPVAVPAPVAATCIEALRGAADEAPSGSEVELERSLTACTSEGDWLRAAVAHPEALGLTTATEDDARAFLLIACNSYPDAGIC
jgi:hypothetical protein